MESLGIAPPPQQRTGGSDRHSSIVNSVRSMGGGAIPQAIGAGLGALGGAISGGPQGRMSAAMQGALAGQQNVQDAHSARMEGTTVDNIRNRRALQKAISGIEMGETPESQLAAYTQIAREANRLGMIDVAMNAANQRNQLKTLIQNQKKAGLDIDETELELAEASAEFDMGINARLVTDDKDTAIGKAVRIDSERAAELGLGENAIGNWLYISPNGEKRIVDGSEIVRADDDASWAKLGVGGIPPKYDNVLELARRNGATPGNIPKMRGSLADMATQAGIVTEVSDMFMQLQDPQLMLDLTGKTAIQANRWIRFGENAANILAAADGEGDDRLQSEYTWNGKDLGSAEAQHEKWMAYAKQNEGAGMLDKLNVLRGEAGIGDAGSLVEALPQSIVTQLKTLGAGTAQLARYAEQYWANVMELAYMDARLKEPSNRGLSDKDIENALRRIGAATASPASFAQRQLSMIRRIGDSIDSLGSEFTVPAGAVTRVDDVVDFVYDPMTRRDARRAVAVATGRLEKVYEQGLRSEPLAAPGTGAPAPAAAQPPQPGVPVVRPEDMPGFKDLPAAEQEELKRLWKIEQSTQGAS